MERGDFAAAERHYLGAFNRNPHDALVYLKRGQALLQLGRVAEARNDVDRALQIVPDLTEARRLMGQLCRSLHLYDESAAAYSHVVEDEPNNPAAWLGFAEALALSYTRFDEAPQAFARAASLGSVDPEFLLEVADRNLVNGRFAEAEELLNGVFATRPEVREKPMPNIWLGRALEAQGRPQEARQSYEIALARYRHLASTSQSANAIINATLFAYVLPQRKEDAEIDSRLLRNDDNEEETSRHDCS